MRNTNISIPQQGYDKICKIIVAYTFYKDSATINDIEDAYKINRHAISQTSGFLFDLGIIQAIKRREKRIITDKGRRLGEALNYNPSDVKDAWLEVIQENSFFNALMEKLLNKKTFTEKEIFGAIFQLSDTPESTYTITGARAIIQILLVVEWISTTENKKEYRTESKIFRPLQKKSYDSPSELKPFLEKFYSDYSTPDRCAFIMMRFGDSKFYDEIVQEVRLICGEYNISALRADDKSYSDDLLPNVRTYMHGCGLGIAIFDRVLTDQHNPNVSLEVGYMMALGKPVLLLKDSTMSQLQTDLIGRLYKPFDVQNLRSSLKQVLYKWVREKSLV